VPVKIRKNDDLLGLANIDVIGSSNERLGVMTPAEGLRLARKQGLDLVEVNPRAQPPVCKILDLARFKYEDAKKAARARRGPSP
jgi:translation initiation factor IF-3